MTGALTQPSNGQRKTIYIYNGVILATHTVSKLKVVLHPM